MAIPVFAGGKQLKTAIGKERPLPAIAKLCGSATLLGLSFYTFFGLVPTPLRASRELRHTPAELVALVRGEEIRQPMTITKERKQSLLTQYRRNEQDSGSPEVQVAVLTERINGLTQHMRTHQKDYATRRGLLAMVSRRRTLLDYLRRVNPARYTELIGQLGIRK